VAEPPRATDDAAELLGHGWRQGSIAPPAVAQAVRNDEHVTIPEDALLLIASHDCDVTNPSLAVEPDVEFLVARPVPRLDGNLTRGKNPRRLHMEIQTPDGPCPFEIAANGRIQTDRRRLLGHGPLEGHSLRPDDRQLVARWLAKRYDRAAFPGAFDARWKPAQKKIRRLFEHTGQFLDGVFLALPGEELPEHEPYRTVVRGLVTIETESDPERRAQAQECLDGLAALLNDCAGIEVVDSSLVSEDEFTLRDVSLTKRWDWDYLTGEE
jgi:hypothetical protein